MTTRTLTGAALLAAVLLGATGCGDGASSATSTTPAASGGSTAAASTTSASGSPTAGGTTSAGASGDVSGAASVEPAVAGDPASPSPSATSTLGLVDGFPVDLVPVLPGATVTASTVAARGDRLEVSLSGTTTKTRKAVFAYYGKVFEKAGYTRPKGNRLGPGTVTRVWARGDDVVVVAVDDARPRSFSVGGTVTR